MTQFEADPEVRADDRSAVFVTSDGERIPLEDRYFELSGKAIRADDPTSLFEVQYKKPAEPISFGQFLFKAHEAAWVFDALTETLGSLQFRSMFDLGSGFATLPRIAHRLGYARDVTCCDLFPYGETALPDGRCMRFLAMQAVLSKLGLKNVRSVSRKWDNYVTAEHARLPKLSVGEYKYLVGDIFEQEGQYDWIHSSLTLTHFDHKKLFPKISDLLEDGGIFSFTVECFWFIRNSTGAFGRAPYLIQILSRDDFIRYMIEQHPDVSVEKVNAVYDYYTDPSFPTASTFIETAVANGLHPIFVKRHINKDAFNSRAGTTPAYLEREFGYSMSEILRLVRRRRPDVSLEDLYTSHYLLGFKKVVV